MCAAASKRESMHRAHEKRKEQRLAASLPAAETAGSALKGMSIIEINAAARAHGMTYGQYCSAVERNALAQ